MIKQLKIEYSRCLGHNPEDSLKNHPCIYETSFWIKNPETSEWYKILDCKSQWQAHKRLSWLEVCDTWEEFVEAANLKKE